VKGSFTGSKVSGDSKDETLRWRQEGGHSLLSSRSWAVRLDM